MAKRKIREPKDPDRVQLSTCVGKLMAYVRVNKKEDAKVWARATVEHLKKMGLLDA